MVVARVVVAVVVLPNELTRDAILPAVLGAVLVVDVHLLLVDVEKDCPTRAHLVFGFGQQHKANEPLGTS